MTYLGYPTFLPPQRRKFSTMLATWPPTFSVHNMFSIYIVFYY
jgi:hypothetical protein